MQEPASFYYGVMWNKLYRADIVREHPDVRCNEELDYSEDLYFNLSFIRYAQQFYALSTPIYNYVQNPDSAVHHLNPFDVLTTRFELTTYYKDLFKHIGLYEEKQVPPEQVLLWCCGKLKQSRMILLPSRQSFCRGGFYLALYHIQRARCSKMPRTRNVSRPGHHDSYKNSGFLQHMLAFGKSHQLFKGFCAQVMLDLAGIVGSNDRVHTQCNKKRVSFCGGHKSGWQFPVPAAPG